MVIYIWKDRENKRKEKEYQGYICGELQCIRIWRVWKIFKNWKEEKVRKRKNVLLFIRVLRFVIQSKIFLLNLEMVIIRVF